MLAIASPELDNGPRTDKSATMRMCAVSREVRPVDELIRFVLSPQGEVVPDLKRKLTLADLHSNCDYSIWDGWEFDGFPDMTMVRGNVLVENGAWTGPEGIGQFIPARMPSEPS